MSTNDREIERLINEKNKHKGEWLTYEACIYYRNKAKGYLTNGQDIGIRRELRKELQERFGLLEIEAINILNGFCFSIYIEKYRRIKYCIPLNKNNSKETIEYED